MRPGDLIANRFQIERLANSGGMGAVYRAKDLGSGQTVALKALHQPEVGSDRFQREAMLLAGLRHPSIVRYIAHGTAPGGEGWLAIEWLEGLDLGKRLERGRLGVAESLSLAILA